MTTNERISKWRGEATCFNQTCSYYRVILDCKKYKGKDKLKRFQCPKFEGRPYDSDPSAWTPELFKELESKPICIDFIAELEDEVMLDSPFPRESVSMPWLFLQSTPAQKADALAQAIKEVG